MSRTKYLYRVTAEFPSGWGDTTFTRVWHYQSKTAAVRRERMARTGWSVERGPEDGYTMPPAVSVTFERSQPVEWEPQP